jgi:hypothetical protein
VGVAQISGVKVKGTKMDDLWGKYLPGEFRDRIVPPIVFERHREPSANAVRIIGFDSSGDKCFDCHSFVLTEEGFDADEFPIRFDVYYERVISWRLQHGQWIRLKTFSDQLDRCNRHLTTLPVEFAGTV